MNVKELFQWISEKLTGEKLDVPEVTQSEEGQKQKLGIVLGAVNRVSTTFSVWVAWFDNQ